MMSMAIFNFKESIIYLVMFHPTSVRKTSVFRPYEGCTKYIIDVDTGCDDAQFLVLAIHLAKKLNKEIIGITCVDGNAELKDVVINTLITLKICDVKIKVYKGSSSQTFRCQG